MVAVAVRGHTHSARPCIPLFYHNLVTYTATWWKMINRMLFCKGLDLLILLEIGITGVLDIMIERKDDLTWIMDLCRSHRHKLERNWP